jgi:hypothetical protein
MALLRSREPSRQFYTPIYSDISNAMAIEVNISDATDNPRVRKGTLRVVNTDGTVDYYDVSSAEECNDWKRKIGRYAARFALHPSESAYKIAFMHPLITDFLDSRRSWSVRTSGLPRGLQAVQS